ncbi:hypothetical protein A3C23_01580 [Candidatus Roizmanbacteria bacterium RIFCSPHIGHO2_02_FULL_37_13b]|uniref:SCP domain-containing protein n=1 Tax=Candidatus Roizmanbacteria bacterium RIFCSPLOWO2_02_FULL_36_11 TaxID=1802071 RepID=A0A1F7JII6_9BACT|nr:MAG: hypothetical protein A3C23_01580 [Candidatus Roizmanbacteria bacterium RIFCSPHIGHO2_02_FULL_37_13b]OGK55428.1 MAG: hypothetical protein A3H78_06050 [Candidatus Roizmanbacteria bacterium RIFCSPLOWO2_02_FULL_36_11]
MLDRKVYYFKIISAQLGAYLISAFLVTQVFLVESPLLRPDLPTSMAQKVNNLATSVHSMANLDESLQNFSGLLNSPLSIENPINSDRNANSTEKNSSEYWQPTSTVQSQPSETPTTAPTATPLPQQTVKPTSGFSWPDDLSKWISSIPKLNLPTRSPTREPVRQPTQSPQSNNTNISLSTLEQQTVTLINEKRSAEGKSKLVVNSALTKAARTLSADNAGRASIGQCSHFGSDGSDFIKRANQAGYSGSPFGETIGCGHSSAESIVNGWWSSPPHHAILTNGQVKYIGVGWKQANHTAQTAVVGF